MQRVEFPSRKSQQLPFASSRTLVVCPALVCLLFSDTFQPLTMLVSLHHVAYSLIYDKTKLSVYWFVQNLFPNKFQLKKNISLPVRWLGG